MRHKRQRWQVGDVFTIPTSDGQVAIGQVIAREPDMMRSATIALFDERYPSLDAARAHCVLAPMRLFAVLFATTNHLDSGAWPVIDHRKVAVDPRRNPYEHTRTSGFVGATVTGANIVNEFVNAFYGLVPWDDWKDSTYLDSLLISKDVKPLGRLVYKN
jgi:hypothetical protein